MVILIIILIHSDLSAFSPSQVPGLYVAGWLASGPVGVIATTMHNAYAVSDALIEDHLSGQLHPACRNVDDSLVEPLPGHPAEVAQNNSQGNKRVVSWQDWLRIDEFERNLGAQYSKVREKILTVEKMLKVIS